MDLEADALPIDPPRSPQVRDGKSFLVDQLVVDRAIIKVPRVGEGRGGRAGPLTDVSMLTATSRGIHREMAVVMGRSA